MSTITKEWLQQTIAEYEANRDELPFGLDTNSSIELQAFKLALASLEAEASGRNPVLAYADSYRDMANQGVESIPVWSVITDLERNIAPLFTAPPAPVSVPAAMEIDDDFDSAFEHGKAVGWNAYRAAMLQAEPVSNSDELPLDYLQGHKDGLEWAAQLAEANHPQTGDWLYDDPIDLARAIRKGPDMPTVQAGNSPVTPDGWISCSELMPNDKQYVWCWGKSYGWTECDTFEGYYDWSRNKWWAVTDDGEEPASKVTHWMPLPEPPQEVNRG
ncbi:DUF551 domain-containing protein [Escherichia coli]|nr:DUF551 domain-containing protein [Escherichia coli]